MIIEVNEKVREKFAEEIVSISVQFRYLLKNHSRKLRNIFKEYKILLIALAVMLVLHGVSMLTWMTPDGFSWALILVLTVLLIIYVSFYMNLRKTYRGFLEQKGGSVITLDENGAELNRQNSQVIRLSWDNVAFVRVFKESLCIFSRDANVMLILADIKYADAITGWIKENRPDVEMIM